MKKIALYVFALLAFSGFTACEDGVEEVLEAPQNATIIISHHSPSFGLAENLQTDFFIGNTTTRTDRRLFRQNTFRNPTPGVPLEVALQPAPGVITLSPRVVKGSPVLEPNKSYTALFCNAEAANLAPNAPVSIMLLGDDLTKAPEGQTKVRFVHLGVGAPAVDVYLVPTGGTTPTTPTIANVSYGQTSGSTGTIALPAGGISQLTPASFAVIPNGTYRAEVRVAGTPSTEPAALTINNLNLSTRRNTAGSREEWVAYTIVADGYLAPPAGVTTRNLGASLLSHSVN